MNRVLVTGSTGYIGSSLVRRLLARGDSVLGFSLSQGQDIRNPKSVDDAVRSVDFVYHLAAMVDFSNKNADKTRRTNIEGMSNLLWAVKNYNIKKMVFVSSAITCGVLETPGLIDEKCSFSRPELNPYVYSKFTAEAMCLSGDLPVVVALPSTVNPIKTIFAPPGGTNIIDVEDVVDGLIACMDFGEKGERYLLTDNNISFYELYPKAIKLPRWSMKMCMKFGNKFLIETSFFYKYYTNEKARRCLGWKPQRNPIENFTTRYQEYMKWQTEKGKDPIKDLLKI